MDFFHKTKCPIWPEIFLCLPWWNYWITHFLLISWYCKHKDPKAFVLVYDLLQLLKNCLSQWKSKYRFGSVTALQTKVFSFNVIKLLVRSLARYYKITDACDFGHKRSHMLKNDMPHDLPVICWCHVLLYHDAWEFQKFADFLNAAIELGQVPGVYKDKVYCIKKQHDITGSRFTLLGGAKENYLLVTKHSTSPI